MHLLTLRPLFCQQFLYCIHDPQSHRPALHISIRCQFVGPHGRFNVGCVAMLLYELIGGAEDVEV